MIYVETPHTEDDDVDLFKFADILQACNYIIQNNISEFTISSEDARNMMFEPEDYTNISKTE